MSSRGPRDEKVTIWDGLNRKVRSGASWYHVHVKKMMQCCIFDNSSTSPYGIITTASGSITVGSETLSGTYVSPCNIVSHLAAAAGTSIFPADVKSGKTVIVVTSDTDLLR